MLDFKPTIVWRKPEDLIPYEDNSKLHPAEQIDEIAGQIVNFGFDQPIVITKHGLIIKGHGRREAALRLGLEKVPVIISTIDEYAAISSRIGDNKVAETGWDNDRLRVDFEKLKKQEIDLSLTGFDVPEIDAILNAWAPEEKALDKIDETDDAAKTVIKVKCSPDQADLVKSVLTEALRAADLLMSVDIA